MKVHETVALADLENEEAHLESLTLNSVKEKMQDKASIRDFPLEMQLVCQFVWKTQFPPFSIFRLLGKPFLRQQCENYFGHYIKDSYERHIISALTFQLFLHQEDGASEAILTNFDSS